MPLLAYPFQDYKKSPIPSPCQQPNCSLRAGSRGKTHDDRQGRVSGVGRVDEPSLGGDPAQSAGLSGLNSQCHRSLLKGKGQKPRTPPRHRLPSKLPRPCCARARARTFVRRVSARPPSCAGAVLPPACVDGLAGLGSGGGVGFSDLAARSFWASREWAGC